MPGSASDQCEARLTSSRTALTALSTGAVHSVWNKYDYVPGKKMEIPYESPKGEISLNQNYAAFYLGDVG